jgi:hypothetical protein
MLDAVVLIHLVHHRLVGTDDHAGIVAVEKKKGFTSPGEEILLGSQVE